MAVFVVTFAMFSFIPLAFEDEIAKDAADNQAQYSDIWTHVRMILHCFDWCKDTKFN